jgi:predicted DNA-binding helix-hairpin-helix protein
MRPRLLAAGLLLALTLSAQSPPLDLNTATPTQLLALPGMGQVYVRRIVQGRPYSAKNQLITRGVLPAAAYQRIKDRIVAHRATANIGPEKSSRQQKSPSWIPIEK